MVTIILMIIGQVRKIKKLKQDKTALVFLVVDSQRGFEGHK